MNEYTQKAIDKLHENPKVTDRHYTIIKDGVIAALESFIKQDDEFAQAVVQGGTMTEMFATVCKNISGNFYIGTL